MNPQDHYAALIESADDAIIAKDLDGRVVSWNPAAERLFGWTSGEMVGNSIRRLLPDDRQHEEDRIIARVKKGERIGLFLTRRLHKDGHEIPVAVTISPVRDADGHVIGASKIARDASEHAAMEDRLSESETRFRMLADNMAQLAWIADADGAVQWFNRRWYEFTGIEPDTVDEELRRHVRHPDHEERVRGRFEAAIRDGTEWQDVFPLKSAAGEWRWFLSHAQPIRDAEGNVRYWFGTNTDITEQREQSEQITVLLREVNHRSKNMLAKVQALARSSFGADTALVQRFEDRVGSLSVNQDILVSRDWREVPVDELVRLQLQFISGAGRRVSRSGPDCALIPRAAEIIGMSLHELATNSLKYGALSVESGRVAIEWACVGGGFRMAWRESGGPAVAEPTHRGFGSQLIEDIPRRALQAQVVHTFAPEGLVWDLTTEQPVIADPVRNLG
ncbi:PAS domain S-box protein [Tsuneonella sp. HG094]